MASSRSTRRGRSGRITLHGAGMPLAIGGVGALGALLLLRNSQGVRVQPLPPQGLRPTAISSLEVDLAWDSSRYADLYVLRRDSAELLRGALTNWVDVAGIAPSTQYSYTIAAANELGESAPSAALLVTTPPSPIPPPPTPAPPTNLRATGAGPGSVAMAWDASANATGYTLSRDQVVVGVTAGLQFVDNGVTPGALVRYTVTASNGSGTSAPSAVVAVLVPRIPAAPAGVGLASRPGPFEIDLAWNHDPQASSHTVLRDGNVIATGVPGDGYADTAVQPNSQYSYQVIAENVYGTSPPAPVPALTVITPVYFTDAVAAGTSVSHSLTVPAGTVMEADVAWTPGGFLVQLSITDSTGTTVLASNRGLTGSLKVTSPPLAAATYQVVVADQEMLASGNDIVDHLVIYV